MYKEIVPAKVIKESRSYTLTEQELIEAIWTWLCSKGESIVGNHKFTLVGLDSDATEFKAITIELDEE